MSRPSGKVWLAVDSDNLAARNFFALPGMQISTGEQTAVCYGVLRDVVNLCERYDTRDVAFCWDSDESLRRQVMPSYKVMKSLQSPSPLKDKACLKRQKKILREEILPALGFRNSFCYRGYEADDVLAQFVRKSTFREDGCVVVSTDQDLYQLLSERVTIFNPLTKKEYKMADLRAQYNVYPPMWAEVKAIAGCRSDGVLGVAGVREKTAANYVSGSCKPDTLAHKRITAQRAVRDRNMVVVRLPFLDCPIPDTCDDEVSVGRIEELIERMSFGKYRSQLLRLAA